MFWKELITGSLKRDGKAETSLQKSMGELLNLILDHAGQRFGRIPREVGVAVERIRNGNSWNNMIEQAKILYTIFDPTKDSKGYGVVCLIERNIRSQAREVARLRNEISDLPK